MKNTTLRLFSIFLIMLGFSTCNNPSSGLGEKVDIYAPVVSIDSPAINSYVKGTITVTGKATDDFGLTSAELTYKAKDGSTVKKTLTIAVDGSWTIDLVSGTGAADELPDGNQSITVTANDGSAKSGAITTILNVDNVPPTTLVTAPLSYGGVIAAPQTSDYIDLKGEVYDASPIMKVTVTLYRPDGTTVLASQDADGTNTWSTRFWLKDQPPTITGLINDIAYDNQIFTYKIAVTDKSGNVSSAYYHRSDIYGLITGVPGALFPTMDELGKIDQAGTGTGPLSKISYASLSTKKLASGGTPVYADFKYLHQAKADIKFTNLDRDALQAVNVLGLQAPVTGIITPPAGFGGVVASSVVVRIYSGNIGSHPTLLTTISDSDNLSIDTDNISIQSLGDSVSFIVKMRSGGADLAPGAYYMEVDGLAQGASLQTQKVEFLIDSAFPVLTEDNLGIGAQFWKTRVQLGGNANSGSPLDRIEIEASKDGGAYALAQTYTGVSGLTSHTWTSNNLPATLADGVYDFKVTLWTQSSKYVTLYRSVTIDTTAPSVEVTRLDPVVGTNSVNGVVNFGATASDGNGVSGTKYWILTTVTPAPTGYADGTGTPWTPPYATTIDTTALTDNTDYKAYIISKDKAANETMISTTFHVDQSTDVPVVTLTNMDVSIDTAVKDVTPNLQESSPKIQAAITDDDGVDVTAIQVLFDKTPGSAVPSDWKSGVVTGSGKTVNFTYDMASMSEGKHYFYLRASDDATKKLTKPAVTKTTGPVYFAIDKANPAITVTNPANAFKNADFTISGTASDTGTLKKIEFSTDADFSVPGNIVDITGANLGLTSGAWTKPITIATQGADGLKTFYFRVTDAFNKTTTVSWTYNKDVTAPTGSISTPNADGSIISTGSFNFGGNANDGTGAGVAKIQYAVVYTNDANDANDTWVDGIGTNTWTVSVANMATTFGAEGNKVIGIRFQDTLGNVSASIARTFIYDTAIPVVTVTGGANQSKNAGFTLAGTASDNYGVASIAITQKKDSGSAVPVTVNGPTGTTSWSLANLPRNEASIGTQLLADGTYTYNITATDSAGRVSSVYTVTVLIDRTAPTPLVITSPTAGMTGLNSLSGVEYNFRATASDGTGSGMAKIYYLFSQSATAPAGTAGYSSSVSTGTWSITDDFDIDGPGADTGRAEGNWYLHVKAEDAAGNVTADGSVVTMAFGIDQSNPVIAETGIGTTASVTKNTAFTINGTASDTNASSPITVTATRSKDGAAATAVTVTGTTTWTFTETPTLDGTYVYIITATDAAGKTTSVTRTVRWDTTGPAATIVNPTAGAISNFSTVAVNGVAADLTGVKSIYYALGAAEPAMPADKTADGNWTAAGWGVASGGSDWSLSLTGLTEGAKTIWIRAYDTANNVGASVSRSFYVDSANPVIAETGINTASMVNRNAAYTINGTASDTNSLTSVTATVSKDGAAATSVIVTGSATWTFTQDPTDGVYTYVITATDAVGKTSTVTRIVKVDKTAPTPTITEPAASAWLSSGTVNVTGVASDSTGTGVKSVYYYLGASELALPGTITSDADWTGAGWSVATGTSSWTAALTGLTEGAKTIWIRSIDNANNLSGPLSRAFGVDLSSPIADETSIGAGTGFKNAAFSLIGTSSDTNGITSVTVTQKKDAGAAIAVSTNGPTGTTSWTLANLPRNPASIGSTLVDPGVYEYLITVTDAAGKTVTLTRTVTVDTVAPTAQITSVLPILTGNIVNGKVTLSANASDINGLTGVKYFLKTSGTPAYTDAVAAPLSGVLTAPYSAVIDTTLLTDNLAYELWVLVRDKAGNDTAVHQTINISQSSDTPSGTIDSPGAGLLIGNDKKIRGTFSDDDGVAASGASLYVRKVGAGSWTTKAIPTAAAAGQLVAWTIDVTSDLASDGNYEMYLSVTDDAAAKSGLAVKNYVTPSVGNLGVTPAPQTFLYDVTPPTVSAVAVSPVKTAYKSGDVLTFTWTASDASGLASQATDVDNSQTGLGSITNPSGTNYQVIYTVPASGVTSGNKTLTLLSEDNTGRTTSRSFTFLVDVDAPVVDPGFTLNPGFIGSTPNGAFEVKGTSSDNRSIASVQVNLSGPSGNDGATWTNATLSSGNWTYAITNSATYVAASGTLTINVRAVDQAGNVSTTRVFTQTVDQAADKPVVTLISPVNGSTYGTTVQVSGTAFDDDNLADIDNNGTLDANGIEIQYWGPLPATTPTTVNPTITGSGQNANFNYSLSGLLDGTFVVKSRAKDDNGTWGDWTSDVSFSVNAGAPNLVVSTSLTQYRSNPSLTLTGTVADTDGVSYVRARVNGGSWTNATAGTGSWGAANKSDTWTVTVALGGDGVKTIEVETADPGSFINNKQLSTTLDSTSPVASFDAQFKDNPTGSLLNLTALNKVVRITGVVTELNVASVMLSIDGGTAVAVTGTSVWSYVWTTGVPENGSHNLALTVTDLAGNSTTVNQNVTVNQSADNPVPASNFVPAGTAALAGNNVLSTLLKASGTISDDDGFNSGAVSIYLDGNGTPVSATNTTGTTGTWEYTWGTLTQGTHYINITATDKNGQASSIGPIYFLVDTANPTLTVAAPVGGSKVKAGTLTVSGTATDLGGLALTNPLVIGLRHSNVSSNLDTDTFTPTITGGNFSQDITIDSGSLDGTLYIDLTLTDQAGRVTTITRTITIDITAPTVNPTYPSPGAYLNGLMSFIGTADDANGLSDVTLEVLNPVSKIPVASINKNGTTLASWEFPFNSFAYATTTYAIDVNGDGKLWRLYYRLRALDTSGNATEVLVDDEDADALLNNYPSIYIDTDGDKPTISVTQPKNGDKIGGFVNMYGTATDDDGPVMQVEVRIDFNGDGDFLDTRDIDNSGGIQLGTNQNIMGNTVKIGDPAHKWEDESAWYVVSASNNSWTLELNGSGELYATNTGGTGNIVIQTRSRDMFGLASEVSSRTITLDQTFPQINNALPLDQTYQSGTFNVTAAFGDNLQLNLSGNSQIKININKSGYITLPAASPYLTANGNNGYDLSYPVNTNTYFPGSSGILYVDLYVKDESNYTNQKSMTFYVDNQKPTGAWSDRVGAPDGLNEKNGMVTINAANLAYLEGNYGDSGTVSGVDRVEVFFAKAGNILKLKGGAGTLAPPSTESVTVESWNGSAWTSASETLPMVANSSPGFGDNYVIKIDKPTEMNSSFQGADSDGDGYYEFLGIVGSPRFRAAFDSQYLPDGKLDIHYVVYDLAGNRTHMVRRGFVANNKPEITTVEVGTDLNGNGTLDAGELSKNISVGLTDSVLYSGVKGRNNRLFFQVTATSGNGTKRYSMVYNSVERNGTLTSNAATVNTSTFTDSTIVTAGSFVVGQTYTILTQGDTVWASVGASSATVGTTFVATAAGSGTGTAGLNQAFTLKVFDSTTSDDASAVDELSDTVTLNLMIYNVDTVAPTVTIAPFGQVYSENESNAAKTLGAVTDYNDNILLKDLDGDGEVDDRAGHVEYAASSLHNGTDSDVSGEVIFKGKVEDNQRIQRITATIPGFDPDGAGAAAAGSEFDIWTFAAGPLTVANRWTFALDGTNNLTETYGQVFNWNFTWNSALITTVALNNQTVTFKVYDFRATPNTSTDQITVDVVPYITEILRNPTNYNTNRTRYGKVPVQQSEANIQVKGFNILLPTTQTATNWVRLYSAATAGNADAAVLTVEAAPAPTTSLFEMTTGATSQSGYLRLAVNNIEAINGINNNTLAWNKEDDSSIGGTGGTNTKWTDDRYLLLFQVGDFFEGSNDPEHPSMSIDTASNPDRLYGSWANFAASRAYTAGPNSIALAWGNRTALPVGQTYDPPEWTDLFVDGQGDRHAIILENYYGGTGSSTWGNLSTSINAGSRRVVDNMGDDDNNTVDHSDGYDEMLYQFRNPRIAVVGDGTTNDQYVSYYDYYGKSLKYSRSTNGAATFISLNNMTNGATVVDGVDDFDNNPDDSGADVGVYSSIQIDSIGGTDATGTHRPVIAYYDTTNKVLKVARGNSSQPSGTANWTKVTVPNTTNIGQYVSMKIDATGALHIVAFKNSTGDLVYITAANVDGTASYTFSTPVVIDSFGSVGAWADLELNGNSPVISYLNSTGIGTYDGLKYAYIQSGTGSSTNDWETVIVPANTSVMDKRTSLVYTTDTAVWNGNVAFGYGSTDFDIVYMKRQIP